MYITKKTRKKLKKNLDITALVIVLIGALNWGIMGALDINIIFRISQATLPILKDVIYWAIGLSGLYLVINSLIGFKKG